MQAGISGAPSTAVGHPGIRRCAIVHPDQLEDYMPDASGQVPRRPRTDPFTSVYGVVYVGECGNFKKFPTITQDLSR